MSRVTEGLLGDYELSLHPDRYQEIMQIPINAFNGLNDPLEMPKYQCATIWNQELRDMVAFWFSVAEQTRIYELNYHLSPKYIVGEEHDIVFPVMLDRKHLIAMGTKATSDIELGVTITHRTEANAIIDPVVITMDDGTAYSESEVVVYYPGEDVAIRPSRISISGTVITIHIPRARLVKPELNDNRSDHLQYINDDNFLTEVDVKRVYTAPDGAATYVWYNTPITSTSTLQSMTAVPIIQGTRAYRISSVEVYANGCMNLAPNWCGRQPTRLRMSYLSGKAANAVDEVLTVRLAHTLMPNKPSNCPVVDQFWDEDNTILENGVVTPYGNTQGAMKAWIADSRAKVGIAGTF